MSSGDISGSFSRNWRDRPNESFQQRPGHFPGYFPKKSNSRFSSIQDSAANPDLTNLSERSFSVQKKAFSFRSESSELLSVENLLDSIDKKAISDRESCQLCKSMKGKNASFREAVSKLKEIKLNHFMINALFSKEVADEEKIEAWTFRKTLFDQLPEEFKTSYNLNSFMNLAGKMGDFKRAKKAFEELSRRKITDSYTYATYICIAGKHKDFDEMQGAFNQSLERGLANSFVCNNYINKLSELGHLHLARATSDLAIKRGEADECTYASSIELANKDGDFASAKEMFDQAVICHRANSFVYASYIRAARNSGQFDEAKRGFDLAIAAGVANNVIFNLYINASGIAKEFPETKRAFKEATLSRMEDCVTYAKYIEMAGLNGEFEEATCAFNDAIFRGRVDEAIYSCYIGAAIRNQKFEIADKICQTANRQGFSSQILFQKQMDFFEDSQMWIDFEQTFNVAFYLKTLDVKLYDRYILIAGRNGQFEKAKEKFDEALSLGIANSYTYSCYIRAAQANLAWEEAERGFDMAIRSGNADSITFNIYLGVAGSKKDLRELSMIFKIAQKSGKTDSITLGIYLHHLVELEQEPLAKDLFKQFGLTAVKKQQDEMLMLDLHECTYGVGYLMLLQQIEDPNCPNTFGLIPGKGAEEYGNFLQFKNYLMESIEKKLPDWDCRIDPSNEGVLILNRLLVLSPAL